MSKGAQAEKCEQLKTHHTIVFGERFGHAHVFAQHGVDEYVYRVVPDIDRPFSLFPVYCVKHDALSQVASRLYCKSAQVT